MTNEKYFQKTISQWEFDHGLCTNLPSKLVTSYLSWQNFYPNIKTASHIKLKFYLWTKLLENVLLAKYLLYSAAILNVKMENIFRKVSCSSFLVKHSCFLKVLPIKFFQKIINNILLFFSKCVFQLFQLISSKSPVWLDLKATSGYRKNRVKFIIIFRKRFWLQFCWGSCF